MRVCTLASSSSGNCTVVSQGETHLLIDAGISLRRIRDGLRHIGLTPGDLSCVLVTHDHIDHISGVRVLLKYHSIPVYSSYGAACGISAAWPETSPYLNIFETGAELDMSSMTVRSFSTPHDASGSVGFTVHAGGVKLVYVTDLGYVTDEIVGAALGADIAVIEANHDREMLKNGQYPPFLKKRILSKNGHLANNDSADFAVRLAASGSRYISLVHLSSENNTPELARRTVGTALSGAGFIAGKDVDLDVAPRDVTGRIYEV